MTRILLHSCCAPCSSSVIERLSQEFAVTVFYYNPNIYPREEYLFRKEEQKRFIESFPTPNPVDYLEGDYEESLFYETVKGYEKEPEKGARCSLCFNLRLSKTAMTAARLNYDLFATTLTLSPMKDAELLNIIGKRCGEEYGVEYYPSNFKKKGGYLRSTQICKEYGMYRQNYCGCVFSIRE